MKKGEESSVKVRLEATSKQVSGATQKAMQKLRIESVGFGTALSLDSVRRQKSKG